jgi:hypothetical protein
MTQTDAAARTSRKLPARVPTCFVSAPPGIELATLSRVLQDKHVRLLRVPAGSATDQVTSALAEADFVIAVLNPGQSNANAYFEVGYAAALGKRVLLIAPPELDAIPADLEGLLQLRTNLENLEALEFALDQLLAAPHSTPTSAGAPPNTDVPIGPLADRLLEQLDDLGASITEERLEKLIETALRASGLAAIVRADQPNRGVNFSVWSDSLVREGGAPLLVEVRKRIRPQGANVTPLVEVMSHAAFAGAYWGLLLYLEAPPLLLQPDLFPDARYPVLLLGVRDFLNGLREHSFAEVVRELRIRRAQAIAG